jgi:hypothetical protein
MHVAEPLHLEAFIGLTAYERNDALVQPRR